VVKLAGHRCRDREEKKVWWLVNMRFDKNQGMGAWSSRSREEISDCLLISLSVVDAPQLQLWLGQVNARFGFLPVQ
jgi:hypothetical protein